MSNGALMNGGGVAGVLICDDNEAVRMLLGVIVDGSPGLRVVGEAGDGYEAIAETTRLQPDAILLDLAMPRRSGLEALPELRLIAPDARIIVVSGFAGSSVAEQVIALGATTYLEKGASPEAIVATIEHAMRERQRLACERPAAVGPGSVRLAHWSIPWRDGYR